MSKTSKYSEIRPSRLRDRANVATLTPENSSCNSVIESIGVYLPPNAISTSEVLHACKRMTSFSPERLTGVRSRRIERLTGIRSRRMAGDNEFAIDLAKQAIAKCLTLSKYHPSEIDLLVCCNISRYDAPHFHYTFEPSTSIRLRKHFGLTNALTFDIANACAGMFTALKVVDALIKAGLIDIGMIVSGEYITHLTKTAQHEITSYTDSRLACLTLGDAGAALIVEKAPDERVGFHTIDLYTAGAYSDYCIGKPTDQEHGGAIMFTESVKLHEVAIKHTAVHLVQMLKKANWGKDALHHIIFHQTNQNAIHQAVRRVNELAQDGFCHDRNIVINLAERGNTASTTHFVAVWDNVLSGKMKSGDNVLFATQASGLTIGSAAYTFDDLPDRIKHAESGGSLIKSVARSSATTLGVSRTSHSRIRIESFGLAPETKSGDRDSIELVHLAADQCLAHSSYKREDVEVLIHTGVHRNDFICEPAMATMIAGAVKLNETGPAASSKQTFAFDLFNSSLGFLQACYVGVGMIRAQAYKTVMVVASEIDNNAGIPWVEPLGLAEVGSAVILDTSPENKVGFGNFVFKSFPDYIEAFSSWLVQQRGRTGLHLERNGDLEAAYLECIPSTVEELLHHEGLQIEDLAVILPPQISPTFVSCLSKKMQASKDKFVDLTQAGKDLFSSTLAYTFQHVREQRLVQRGDIGLIINVGTGVQVGCTIYYF